ncbi:MAG TPA: helix-turn-helix domain-containing protein, partial [Candidatus Pacebacteria bacterium]|nr:helix-turn-helix domain-containing protein [Candidatus Paceibacterota bacterium]
KVETVTSVAKQLNVSRKTIYQWLNRYKIYGIDGLLKKKRKYNSKAHNRISKHIEEVVVLLAKQFYTEGVESLSDILFNEYIQ